MQAAIFRGAFAIQVEQIPDAAILEPTDAVVQITHACICGTDLWPYRGQGPYQPGWQIGHEWMGMVMDVGSEVRTITRGDRVIASYDFCDGTCEFCQKGLDSACVQGGVWGFGHEGGQAEAIRARFADATLVVIPPSIEGDEAMLKAILPLTDVMAAGHHAAVTAGVRPGGSVVVIGDGAVGLCATLAARRLGAGQIIALGHQPHRLTLARQFGASEVIASSGEQATGGGPGVCGNGGKPHDGGEYVPSWWQCRVCRSATWERTASTWTHVFFQYRRTRRTGTGSSVSSRTP